MSLPRKLPENRFPKSKPLILQEQPTQPRKFSQISDFHERQPPTVTVKLSGIIDRGNKTDKVSFDETTIKCNIGGNGSKSESHMLLTEPILKGTRYINETVTLSYTVVNVTGTVSRA